jgi:hypothetical protein
MATIYNNISALQVTGMDGLYHAVNTASHGLFSVMTVLILFFVMLMGMRKYPFPKVLLASSFVSFLVSTFFLYMNEINIMLPLGFLILASGTLFYLITTKQ